MLSYIYVFITMSSSVRMASRLPRAGSSGISHKKSSHFPISMTFLLLVFP